MQLPLISHSPDLNKLNEEGYQLEIDGGYLLVHHIPYLNVANEIKYGVIVCVLNLVNPNLTGMPPDHTVYFIGDTPYNSLRQPLNAIINNSAVQQLTPNIVINHFFSSKPASGRYPNYYEKIRTYAEILSSHAQAVDSTVSSRPGKKMQVAERPSVFQYPDTNSAKAKISTLNEKFNGLKIAIIGLGGTGSYILDLTAKTPVQEIHLYDNDNFELNNAFRAPGAIAGSEFGESSELKKVDHYRTIYSKMHKGIVPHVTLVTEENIILFSQYDFVFICIDSNSSRTMIIKELLKFNVNFIDVGLGVNVADDFLIGTVRVTSGSELKCDHLQNRIGQIDQEENEYATNIQIADLNCLNAVLAIIKWKKQVGFYQDLKRENNSLYFINTNKLLNEDFTT
jgi:hypothetical protein